MSIMVTLCPHAQRGLSITCVMCRYRLRRGLCYTRTQKFSASVCRWLRVRIIVRRPWKQFVRSTGRTLYIRRAARVFCFLSFVVIPRSSRITWKNGEVRGASKSESNSERRKAEKSPRDPVTRPPEMEEKEVETAKEGLVIDREGGEGAQSNHTANSAAAGTPPVSSITFHDLSYEVTQRKCFRRLPNKIVLHSVRSVG